jgi:FKBP-type peptidyl-prolyl cis-trans isomerase 2
MALFESMFRCCAGEWSSDLLLEYAKSDLPPDAKWEDGEMVTSENGSDAIIRDLGHESVILDCNFWLAGHTLTFDVELMDLTKANP